MESKIERKEVRSSYEESHTAQAIIGTVFGLMEAMLAFRFIFKLFGANPQSGFVKGIYSATQFFVGIFQGIFSLGTAKGVETTAIFEPGTLIAMIILAITAWVVLKLVKPRDSNRIEKTEYKANE
jgi:hypothetical protein